MEYVEVEIEVIVDENGDAVAVGGTSVTGLTATELWQQEIGDIEAVAMRKVLVTVRVPKPRPATVTVTVPDLPNDASATVA